MRILFPKYLIYELKLQLALEQIYSLCKVKRGVTKKMKWNVQFYLVCFSGKAIEEHKWSNREVSIQRRSYKPVYISVALI